MARARDDMREVELVEAPDGTAGPTDGAAGDGDAGAGSPRPPAARPSPRARARLRAASVVVVGGAVVAGTVGALVTDRREAARLRALADVPGVLAPLHGPVAERWTTDGWPTAAVEDVDGRLVTVLSRPGAGLLEAVALDPLTGAARWRTALGPTGTEDPRSECAVPRARAGAAGGPDGATVLACVVVDEVGTSEIDRGVFPYPVRSRLVVVDAVTGEVLDDRPVASPASVGTVGGDLVLGTLDDDGHARVVRVDPRSGEERWAFTGPDPVPEDELGLRHVHVEVAHDVVVVDAGTVWALSADGDVRAELSGTAVPFGGSTQVIAGGRVLAHLRERADGPTTELVHLDDGRTTSLPGYVVAPHPDDGSLPGTVLVSAPDVGGLMAHDLGTGATLWTRVGHDSGQPVVLDGRVLTVDGAALTALDGATGEEVWSTEVPGASTAPLLTDGRVALVSVLSMADSQVMAFDVRDGRRVWTASLDEQHFLFTSAGHLLGYGDEGLVVLGDGAESR